MKKYFIGAAALLAFTACSNDETVDLNQDGNVISFAVTANNPSRAVTSEVFNNAKKPESFTVYAAHGDKTYFTNETFTKDASDNYTSAATHYWPSTGEVSFLAFRNNFGNLTWNPDAASSISNFTIPANASDQKDFIYAFTKKAKTATGQTTLNFRHGLAQVVFKAKVTNPNLFVEIEGVSVCNAKNTGTFTFPFTGVTDDNHQDATEGAFDFTAGTQGTWSAQSGKVNYTLAFPNVKIANGHTENLTAHDAARETDVNTLLLLPQNTTAWAVTGGPGSPVTVKPADQNGAYFLVKCKIRNVASPSATDPNGGVTADDVYLWGTKDEAQNVAVPATFNWLQGKKYIITFVFGNGNGGYNPDPTTPGTEPEPVLVPISFTITVDDFAKVESEVEMAKP